MNVYPDKTVMKMHSDQLGRQIRPCRDMFLDFGPNNLLGLRTCLLIEILSKVATLTSPKDTEHCQTSYKKKSHLNLQFNPFVSLPSYALVLTLNW